MPATPSPVHFFIALYAGWVNRHQLAVIECLQAEVAVLREHVPQQRIRFTDRQRLRLAHAAKKASRAVLREVATLAAPDTLLRWYREMIARKYDGSDKRCPGRPPIDAELRKLIVQLATDNTRWGLSRIVGELRALGIDVGRSTIRRVLLAVGMDPEQRRGRGTRCRDFLRAHWDSLAATDFFTVEVLTWHGIVRLHVLLVIELQSRRVELAGIARDPHGAWMMQMARNLLDAVDGFLLGKSHLIMDRDPVFTGDYRRVS